VIETLDLSPEPRPAYSRALLLPGPLPPLSHFGITLLRYAVGTGLRYALYHLGLPLPDSPPVKTIRLRPYLDARELRSLLLPAPGARTSWLRCWSPETSASGRRRIAPWPPPYPSTGSPLTFPGAFETRGSRGDESPRALWRLFATASPGARADERRGSVRSRLGADRRALRARGEEVPPRSARVPGFCAPAAGRPPALRRARPLLSLLGGGAGSRQRRPPCAGATTAAGPRPLPGRFRESWRAGLCQLAPIYRALARSAAEREYLADPSDAFFLPLDTAEDLTAERKPAWIESAVRGNRLEYDSLRKAAEPLDLMTEKQEMGPSGRRRAARVGLVAPAALP